MRTSSTLVVTVLGIGVGALVVLWKQVNLLDDSVPPAHPSWVEVEWPFPMDQWGKGKAFRCEAADCGVAVDLYVRPKLGSCNCTTGVGSDEDLDRMSDFDLLGGEVSPLAGGRPVSALTSALGANSGPDMLRSSSSLRDPTCDIGDQFCCNARPCPLVGFGPD